MRKYEQIPTSSQNTNVIAMLPESTSPSMLKQNSDKDLKKAVIATRPVQMLSVGQRHFMIDVIVDQFVMHVAGGIKMNAGGNQRHHARTCRPSRHRCRR